MSAAKAWIFLLVALLLDTAGAVLFKQGMNRLPEPAHAGARGYLGMVTAALKRKEIALGLGFYALEAIAWLGVLSYTDLSIAFATFSANNVLILLASYFFLKEKVGANRWVGVALIIAGISLVGGAI